MDDFLGGADTYHVYSSEVAATTTLLKESTATADTARALTELISEQAQMAGWAAFDAGLQTQARKHYLDGLSAAKEAQNLELAGNSLAFLAYQMVSTQRSGVDTAQASYETAGQNSAPRVRALLSERLAWAHAVSGNTQEADRALGKAAEHLATDSSAPAPDWVFWVDEREIQIMSGRCWTELRRPLRAVPLLRSALAGFSDTHARDKAMYSTWLARALIDAGEIEQAVDVVHHAADLSDGVASVRPAIHIATVMTRLEKYRTTPAVHELFDRVGSTNNHGPASTERSNHSR
ncbi:MAG: XRE family transcriptional regulator [Actinomycetota bacterium]|nr:XRE family transcriptional regulator [Actinomycetota bacterium]